jgi:hypothetical protein
MTEKSERNGPTIRDKGRRARVDIRILRDPPPEVTADGPVRDLAARLAPVFYLDVGNVCNQRCTYCAVPRDELYQTSCEQALTLTAGALAHGYHDMTLIGGEPTIWPHLERTLLKAKTLGIRRVLLTTNGLMLAYPEFVTNLPELGIDFIALSYDDFNPEQQQMLSGRPDNPGLLAKAMNNLSKSTIDSYLYAVVTGSMRGRGAEHTTRFITETDGFVNRPALFFAALKPLPPPLVPRPTSQSVPTLSETATEIAEAIGASGSEVTVAFRDVPLCLMLQHLGHSMDLYHQQAALDLATGTIEPAPLARDRCFVDTCTNCRLATSCPGIYKDYLLAHGENEFHHVP